ncbi:DegT/DnrJ/EryC1/StrS aminotransferase family protein [Pantoea sp. Nvir]|uniref:DegT/DnrJ/EryC1/StrS family aminotransferase n=1 Tax=Pantoea sp. Nvir TaxID=2576760 RepID=UPI00135770A4|nr:aminotransferase class V-fold PLP-dependent enzyme [Pantoea sp. Nvir]MXP67110.1 aminotransferase class V-fold PLP-dependent enzyme [Pantoea sp. Nvir]CAJ0993614.1 UDP-4-amino-4-deoxy-L-arabinose--oxoglutarate aminotransferase [Pantoea sp. Nvir]
MNVKYSKFIHPKITNEICSSVQTQLMEEISIYDDSGIYERLERKFKEKFNVQNAIAVNSGTTALFSMFYGAGITHGDEVIVPSYTFFATCAPLHQLGAELKFADCGDNGNIDPQAVESLVTSKTKAVVITHMWGIPCDLDALMDICSRHNLLLLEDSSHAHGATWDGKIVGSFADGAAWSFQGKKILTSGEGGFFATKHRRMYERAVLVGHFNKRAIKEVCYEDLKDFSTTGTGLNLRMHPLAAAVVLPQMDYFEQMMEEKRETALLMKQGIDAIKGLKVVRVPEKANPAWYALPILFNQNQFIINIKQFVEQLNKAGAVEADIPGSTCPLEKYFLFHSPHKISQIYSNKIRIERENFINSINFHNSMFKLDVWYGDERFNFIENYLSIINKVSEQYRK